MTHALLDPALTVAIALAAGMLAQSVARHLRLPGIVLLLATGVLLGPDVLGWVRPEAVAGGVPMLVGFAVAIILFEGGLNLNLSRLKRQATVIRRLVTWGALITAAGAGLGAYGLLDWDWRLAVLFGALMVVTGPTVVTPLLRRIRLQQRVATVLEWEAVLIDPLGAILAAVTLDVVLHPSALGLGVGLLEFGVRLGAGTLIGVAGGVLIAGALRLRHLVPEGLENVLTLSLVLVLYQVADLVQAESGILAVTVAGLVVGNVRTHGLRDLMEFKEQLTVLMIGVLFVLLAASVRLEDVRSLGWAGVLVVLLLMLVVRPVQVAICSLGTELSWRERLFVSWMAPRGIVAAAVASLFATVLTDAGVEGGAAFRAMVFLVIAATVLLQGLTGGPLAQWLRLRRPRDNGHVILGADALGRTLAGLVQESGDEVVLIDANPDHCEEARRQGFQALLGSGASEAVQLRADMESRAGALAVTANEEANFLFAQIARKHYRVRRAWLAVTRGRVKLREVEALAAHVLFGGPVHVDLWVSRLERDRAQLQTWVRAESSARQADTESGSEADGWPSSVLPLAVWRDKRLLFVDEQYAPRPGDRLRALVQRDREEAARDEMRRHGWQPADTEPAMDANTMEDKE